MKIQRLVVLTVSHGVAIAAGVAIGIYSLPILIAPQPPALSERQSAANAAIYSGRFHKDLRGSDFFHSEKTFFG